MAERKQQTHIFSDGSAIGIERDGNHQYNFAGSKVKYASTTGIASHIDPGGDGLNYWSGEMALKHNDRAGFAIERNIAAERGPKLHEAIERYIEHGTVDETDDIFIMWLRNVGNNHRWSAAEKMVINVETGSGGTCDALSIVYYDPWEVMIWDWKTKTSEASYLKYRPYVKDHAQIANYAKAFLNMESAYNVNQETAKIAYICTDTGNVFIEDVDIASAYEVFKHAAQLYRSSKELSREYKKEQKEKKL